MNNLLDTFTFAHEAAVDKLSGLCFANKLFNSRLEDRKPLKGKRYSMDVSRQPLLVSLLLHKSNYHSTVVQLEILFTQIYA